MIDISIVMEKFAFFAGITVVEAEEWRPLAVSSAQHIETRLKPGAAAKAVALLASAAAADAYYGYCLLEGTRADAAVTAGSVTVKTDYTARLTAAKSLRDNALAAIRTLLQDDGFAFLYT